MQFVADKNDRFALSGHRTQRHEEIINLLRRQDGGRLIHNKHFCTAIEHLEYFNPLLLPHGKLPDLCFGRNAQAELLRQDGNLSVVVGQAHQETRCVQPQQDVFCDGERGYQHKVLVYHADAVCDGVAWGAEIDHLPVNADGPRILPVESGQDVHQRALAGSVFTQQRMDFAFVQVEVHPVVGKHAGKALDDAPHLDGVDHIWLLLNETRAKTLRMQSLENKSFTVSLKCLPINPH